MTYYSIRMQGGHFFPLPGVGFPPTVINDLQIMDDTDVAISQQVPVSFFNAFGTGSATSAATVPTPGNFGRFMGGGFLGGTHFQRWNQL